MTKTTKTQKNIDGIYKEKAKSSFNSRFNLLLYSHIRNNEKGAITIEKLEDFKIEDNPDVQEEYLKVYWQEEVDIEINGKRIDRIYAEMKQWKDSNKPVIAELQKHYVDNVFRNEVFPKNEFNTFFQDDIECEYCHLTEDLISDLIGKKEISKKHHSRGWSLEIDRKKPNHEYTKDNVVWCCYWCNNAKTDEFSHQEFKIIGETLKQIWDARLGR
jgi:5-methylcytosine-specific restriction endonuclease McrA